MANRKAPKGWSKRFNMKCISANKLWYKNKQMTVDYRKFREEVYDDLKEKERKWPFQSDDQLAFDIKVGFSSPLSDVDNVMKPILDTWQHLFDFNDKYVFAVSVEKELVKKGKEYFEVTVIGY